MGFGQIAYGPITDRFGRRPVLLFGLLTYAVASFGAIVAADFPSMIVARVLQGLFCAAVRVVAVASVRDRYSGREMARVMSLIFIVFLIVPIVAPSVGQAVLLAAPWEWIFVVLGGSAIGCALWAGFRLPETLDPEHRLPIGIDAVAAAARSVVTERFSIGYTLAGTMLFGGLLGYVGSSQQMFEALGAGQAFPLLFAATAAAMGVGSYLNTRIVERVGTRAVSHSALIAFIATAALHVAWAASGSETLTSFSILQAMTLACFSLTTANFNAMAMEKVGHIAGTAASVQGTISTIGGALIGAVVGQQFDGTTLPLTVSLLLASLGALCFVLYAERGRLFRAQHAQQSPAH